MSTGKFMSAGVASAIAASLCCVTPVLALMAGSGSMASSFSWMAPARPYLIGLTIVILGIAWYQKLKPGAKDDCGCTIDKKASFFQSNTFLLMVTLFSVLMISFPAYATIFFPKNERTINVVRKSNAQTVDLNIKGMSCPACEEEVNHEVYKLPGIIQSVISYKDRNAIVQFDSSKTTVKEITDAVNATGYKVVKQTIKN